jgi:DNA-binding NarL/FixJ family response regulator
MSFDAISLMVADDSGAFREGLRALLASVDDVVIVDEAASGDEAVVRAAACQPDVILMDLQMPGVNGIEATRRIRATSPHIAVLMLTAFEDDESVLAAMQAGARGYLLKGSNRREIVQAVEVVSRGGVLFGPGVAKRILDQLSPVAPSTALPFAQLSEREREILSLMGEGIGNTEIAERLSLSEKTVRNHVHNIYSKLQVTSRSAAVIQARDAGLGVAPRGHVRRDL